VVKELGKLAGRNLGRCPPPHLRGRSKRPSSDCLSKTQVCAKAKANVYGLRPAQCRKVKGGSSFLKKLPTEAPVNGSSNYNCSMVAKFLVG